MSAEELRKELRERLETDTKLKALMDQGGGNAPPSSATRIPTSGCGAGQGLKPDRTGFGRWTCQPLGGTTFPQDKHALAQMHLQNAGRGMDATRTAKGQALLSALADLEEEFRQAGSYFAQADDDENRDASYHEAARIALVRFIEERAAGLEYAQGDKGCKIAARHFKTIDEGNQQSVNLVNRIRAMCNM